MNKLITIPIVTIGLLASCLAAQGEIIELTGDDGQYVDVVESWTTLEWGGEEPMARVTFDIYNNSDLSLQSFAVGIDSDAATEFWSHNYWNGSGDASQALIRADDWDESDYSSLYDDASWEKLFTEDGVVFEWAFVGGFDGSLGSMQAQVNDFGFLSGDPGFASPVAFSATNSSGGSVVLTGIASYTRGANPINVNPVPEPATMLLFGTGLVALVGSRLRKKKK